MKTKKWICPHSRSRFIPPTQQEQIALKTLVRSTSASHEQLVALRQLGAIIPAAIMAGKIEIDV